MIFIINLEKPRDAKKENNFRGRSKTTDYK